MLIKLFVEYAPLKHGVQIRTRCFISSTNNSASVHYLHYDTRWYFYTIAEQNVERRFQIAIKSGINRAIFQPGVEYGGGGSEAGSGTRGSLPREVSGNQVNEERGATSRKRRARKRRDKEGLSPNGLRNVAPRRWPAPRAIYGDSHSRPPRSFGPPQSRFPPFSLIAEGTLRQTYRASSVCSLSPIFDTHVHFRIFESFPSLLLGHVSCNTRSNQFSRRSFLLFPPWCCIKQYHLIQLL